MSTSDTTGLVCDLAGLADHVGEQLGHTPWREMTQERVNLFADATDDHQFIHVDPEKAKATPVRRHDRPRLPDPLPGRGHAR